MKITNLHLIIAALIIVHICALIALGTMPEAKDAIKELSLIVLGGLLAIIRPQSRQVGS
jgi:hypothetical protein